MEQVVLFFARAQGETSEITVTNLRFTPAGLPTIGAGATTMSGVISTRRSNGTGWLGMLQRPPIGTWELKLPDTPAMRAMFRDQRIEDILFVVTYGARTAPWPT